MARIDRIQGDWPLSRFGCHGRRSTQDRLKSLTAIVCAAAVSGVSPFGEASSACGQCEYTLLHTLPNGPSCGTFTYVGTIQALADDGSVCGFARAGSFCPEWPFFWSPGDATLTMLTLPPGMVTGRALDLNENYDIVGFCRAMIDGFQQPCVWRNGVPTLLGIPAEASRGEARAINEFKTIVGYWQNANSGVAHAMRWFENRAQDIHPAGSWNISVANDVSDDGTAVGRVGVIGAVGQTRAVTWGRNAVTLLPPVPFGITSEAVAINNEGDIAVTGWLAPPADPGFAERSYIRKAGTVYACGVLPGFRDCVMRDLNDSAIAVGDCTPGASASVVVWRGFELSAPMFNGSPLPAGAWAINNLGRIATARHVYAAVPRPPSDIDQSCSVNVTDLLRVIADWGLADSPADCTNDGIVDHLDLLLVIWDWGQ